MKEPTCDNHSSFDLYCDECRLVALERMSPEKRLELAKYIEKVALRFLKQLRVPT